MSIEVLSPGTLTTVQDWPGRLGMWEVGVPPSGPMDDLSFRLGNRLVGNPEGAAGLEVVVTGPRLCFSDPTVVAVTGAPLVVELDGHPVPQWTALEVPAGGELRLRSIRGVGMRAYVLVAGGIDDPVVLGSRASFTPGKIGGGKLEAGEMLPIGGADVGPRAASVERPAMGNTWTVRVVTGPQGAPDIVTPESLAELLDGEWTVHHHSDRTGVRLDGPIPEFTRTDGGDAGLHPSNILDSAYGVGSVMLGGESAVVVGPDGPSLGGFAVFCQIVRDDLWMLGQMRPGDTVLLRDVTPSFAVGSGDADPVLDASAEATGGAVTYRRAGERALLVEFGGNTLDLRSRVRAHVLQGALVDAGIPGVTDLTPGVRSLHVQFDPAVITATALLWAVRRVQAELPPPEDQPIAARVVHLPLAWRHSQAELAVEKYMTSVWAEAPWCPDNVEFIRRINGLASEEEVRRIVFDASYLVLGLGDVYLGAPVALPIDPRHRLVTTKYTPPRPWTPPNAVGIGGAFMCVYGMEGPGGYQLVGRTVPIWAVESGALLHHFDQIRFSPVSEEELEELRVLSAAGEWAPRVEPVTFSMAEHEAFLETHAASIAAFREKREAAFAAERDSWAAAAAGSEGA